MRALSAIPDTLREMLELCAEPIEANKEIDTEAEGNRVKAGALFAKALAAAKGNEEIANALRIYMGQAAGVGYYEPGDRNSWIVANPPPSTPEQAEAIFAELRELTRRCVEGCYTGHDRAVKRRNEMLSDLGVDDDGDE